MFGIFSSKETRLKKAFDELKMTWRNSTYDLWRNYQIIYNSLDKGEKTELRSKFDISRREIEREISQVWDRPMDALEKLYGLQDFYTKIGEDDRFTALSGHISIMYYFSLILWDENQKDEIAIVMRELNQKR